MITLKIIPNGIPNAGLANTRILVVSESGEELDISHLVRAVSWTHRACDLPICTLELIALKEDGVEFDTMTPSGEIISAVIGPGSTDEHGHVNVTSIIDRYVRKVHCKVPA